MAENNSALLLFSGGQDSATCLAWAVENFTRVETVGFDYGQRHSVELECRMQVLSAVCRAFPAWRRKLGEDHLHAIPVLGDISETALTRNTEIAFAEGGLPNTFVPGRNLMFLTLAAAIAYRRNIQHLVVGVGEVDYSGYPDCRPEYISAFEAMSNLATKSGVTGKSSIKIHTPLIDMGKHEIIKTGSSLGVDYSITHSCYDPDKNGISCGRCDACTLRLKGFKKAGIADPIQYAN